MGPSTPDASQCSPRVVLPTEAAYGRDSGGGKTRIGYLLYSRGSSRWRSACPGKLESLKQATADAVAAEERAALHGERNQNEKALQKLFAEAQAGQEQVKVHRAVKVAAEAAATKVQASVKQLEARLADAKKSLAAETAKVEMAEASLQAIKATIADLGKEAKALKKRVDKPIPGDAVEDAALIAVPRGLVADAARVVEKYLAAAKP